MILQLAAAAVLSLLLSSLLYLLCTFDPYGGSDPDDPPLPRQLA